jgi:hypothetical protein
VTNPFGLDKWNEAGWKPPTPHEVLGLLMTIATAIPLLGITPTGSLGTKLCELLSLACGGMGIASARNYISPTTRSKLEGLDARAMRPNAPTTIYTSAGTDINVATANVTPTPPRKTEP